ncbi:MAG: hypothetical protein IKN53_01410, partial [Oscillibacter sp.]|nr:hypothetical protein [Oscillibacter sp.]
VFARAGDDGFMFYHPSDVRLVREDNAYTDEAMEQWSELNEWAWSVRDAFCTENGLEPFTHTNSMADSIFARAAFWTDNPVTLAQNGVVVDARNAENAQEVLERLVWNTSIEYVDELPETDGEPIVMDVQMEENWHEQLCFRAGSDVVSTTGDYPSCYRITFTDGSDLCVGDLVQEWFALANVPA